ncbi:tubulointerstitial nephritis antigen-like [Aethina tumida]|uniref:tubulointerstitial nephritis antigen-like n=1 Tax=Aethina tumida TaxID=116153 RepID=UPI002147844F|nr:tubulointerstitial nephritis antigen-like [Aethina tumida]
MGRVRWLESLVFLVSLTVICAQIDDFFDLRGPYCETNNACCNGRQDHCSVPILGTLCYCDDFCNSTGTHFDCCPDYWTYCKGLPLPTTYAPPTTTRPSDPLPLLYCSHKGQQYQPRKPFQDNCNRCECTVSGTKAILECEDNICLQDERIIETVNRSPNYGWTAANYSEFWGRTLSDGISLRLGTIEPKEVVMRMQPVIKVYDPTALPRSFDSLEKWPSWILPIQDQLWCGSSWAVSTASVASDRYSIISQGREKVQLSAQNLLSCDMNNMKTRDACNGGHLDKAWLFIRKFGLVDEDCFPYRAKYEHCSIKRKGNWADVGCRPFNPERRHRYKVSPAYRLRNETDIMYEIEQSGPVQATIRVYHDFFSYKSGIYQHTDLDLTEPTGYHSVKIVGWGEEYTSTGLKKYWKVANSWGTKWGENGYFRILKGVNECDIETFVIGVWPEIEGKILTTHHGH